MKRKETKVWPYIETLEDGTEITHMYKKLILKVRI